VHWWLNTIGFTIVVQRIFTTYDCVWHFMLCGIYDTAAAALTNAAATHPPSHHSKETFHSVLAVV
jgi:hypothetical protein